MAWARRADLTVSNLEVSNNASAGITASNANVINSQVLNNEREGIRVWEKNATVSGSTISGNLHAVTSRRNVTISNSTISGNDWGVWAQVRATMSETSISDTSNSGVYARRVRIFNSTVQNNGVDCDGEWEFCFDIGAQTRPSAEGVVCGTSSRINKDIG